MCVKNEEWLPVSNLCEGGTVPFGTFIFEWYIFYECVFKYPILFRIFLKEYLLLSHLYSFSPVCICSVFKDCFIIYHMQVSIIHEHVKEFCLLKKNVNVYIWTSLLSQE